METFEPVGRLCLLMSPSSLFPAYSSSCLIIYTYLIRFRFYTVNHEESWSRERRTGVKLKYKRHTLYKTYKVHIIIKISSTENGNVNHIRYNIFKVFNCQLITQIFAHWKVLMFWFPAWHAYVVAPTLMACLLLPFRTPS